MNDKPWPNISFDHKELIEKLNKPFFIFGRGDNPLKYIPPIKLDQSENNPHEDMLAFNYIELARMHREKIRQIAMEESMTEVKEIGKIIEQTDYYDGGTIAIKRKVSINGMEYNIIPLRCGDYINIPGCVEEDAEKIKAEVKEALLKHIEKFIDIQVIHNEIAGTLGVKAELTIISGKKLEEET